jgi:membrane fusion protein (multidrug efflux system)
MVMVNRIPLIGLVFALALVFTSCKKSEGENGAQKIQPVYVHVEVVTPTRLVDAIQIAGTVKAFEDVNISPEEGGVVKEWKVKKGQHVRKGELIVVLRDEVIKASYDAAKAQYDMAELNLERQKGVYEQQGISELQFRNFQYTRDAAKANAELMGARWERTQIRSPINGVLDNTIPNEGEFAPPGMPIARVVNTGTIKIQAEVPERYAGVVVRGMHAMITIDALQGDTLEGKISFAGSTVSSANRTMPVEIILANQLLRLKPEMVVKVKLLRESKDDALLVSDNVVQLVDRDRFVAYVENNGIAEERHLTLGGRQGNQVEVLEGLKPGDHLIVVGFQKLVNGTPVIVSQ